ncbi:beta-glucan synthesis-associated protein KRE6, partial [Phenoliferia sp. Uapishka_3]
MASTPRSPPASPPSRRVLSSSSTQSPLNPQWLAKQPQVPTINRDSASSSGSAHERDYLRNSSYSYSGKKEDPVSLGLDAASRGVLSGEVGGSFGPFPRSSTYSLKYATGESPFNYRDSVASSDVAIDVNGQSNSHHLRTRSLSSFDDIDQKPEPDESLLWLKENSEADDFMHEPDPDLERMLDKQWSRWSARGYINVGLLSALIIVLIGLFGGWPVYNYAILGGFPSGANINLGWNLGGINGTGQVPNITGLPNLIDTSTPASAYTRTGFDGKDYDLVFSDEFNVDGRTFWPGDDPWWEAVDLHYWATGDLEWYDPDAVTTEGGNLVITLSQEPSHGLNFRSGMLQSWNKFCFTGGYIEVSMSLPGTPIAQGFWPGVWTMVKFFPGSTGRRSLNPAFQGNLGRAGYGATNHGVWPYSYSACDVGTLPNQTFPSGTEPTAAKSSGSSDYGGELSYLPGQRLSACTCPGEDHPGPNVRTGRGAPEIDIIEAQVDYRLLGSASQSVQVAPMDAGYLWRNETPYIEIFDTNKTFQTTSDYIERHGVAYNNPNYTIWTDVPGQTWPKNSMAAAGC